MPLRHSIDSVVIPGDKIGSLRECQPGVGTYALGGWVVASCAGKLQQQQSDDPKQKWVSVVPLNNENAIRPASRVVRVGQVVLGRIVRITLQQAFVDILAIQQEHGGGPGNPADTTTTEMLDSPAPGCIRREDIRTVESAVAASASTPNNNNSTAHPSSLSAIVDSFRPGDLIVARVVSLGDSRFYYLSTAGEAALGVVVATAADGTALRPHSQSEMIHPGTGKRERRHCAQPRQIEASATVSS